jgi:hypothetical protein
VAIQVKDLSERVRKAFGLSNSKFKQLVGVENETFLMMLAILRVADSKRREQGGKPPRIPLEDKLLWTLQYWREYRTMEHLAHEYETSVSHIYRVIVWIENIIAEDGTFSLPGKESLTNANSPHKVVAVDATEHEVERPKEEQEKHYSGKKKRHTIKTQLIINIVTLAIICVAQSEGSVHDFALFKDEIEQRIHEDIVILADSGYQGIRDLHANSEIPFKKSKNNPLTDAQKTHNKELARRRVVIEHVNRKIKTFRILGNRYRNRRQRHLLRVTIIAAITNYELAA